MAIQANTTNTDQDDSTAGAQVRQYLRSKGLEYTAANVRDALAANARNPGVAGVDPIEGLRNYDPGVGQSGSAAKKVGSGTSRSGGAAVNPPPVDLGGNPGGFEKVDSGSAQPTTSAAPQSQLDLTNMILTGLGLGGAGAGGLYAYSKYAGRPIPTDVNGPAREVPNFKLADQYGPNPVVEGEVLPKENLPATVQAEPVGRGEVPSTGRVIDVPPTAIAGRDPLQISLDKAVAPPVPEVPVAPAPAAVPQVTGPVATPSDVRVGLPPGVTGVDAANQQIRAGALAPPPAPAAPPVVEVPPVQAPAKFKPVGPAVKMVDPEGAKGIARSILEGMNTDGSEAGTKKPRARGRVKVPK